MKVYVVTSGEYSDYCIRNVFLDRAKAEQFCAAHNGKYSFMDDDRYEIEEYETADDCIETDMSVLTVLYFYYNPPTSAFTGFEERTVYTFESLFKIKYHKIDKLYYCIMTVPKDSTEEQIKKIFFDKFDQWKHDFGLPIESE